MSMSVDEPWGDNFSRCIDRFARKLDFVCDLGETVAIEEDIFDGEGH